VNKSKEQPKKTLNVTKHVATQKTLKVEEKKLSERYLRQMNRASSSTKSIDSKVSFSFEITLVTRLM